MKTGRLALHLAIVIIFGLFLSSTALADVRLDGDVLVVSNPQVEIRLRGANFESFKNRLTNETYITGSGPGWYNLDVQGAPASLLPTSAWRIETDTITGSQVGHLDAADNTRRLTLVVGIDPATQEVFVRVSGASSEPGVRGVLWGIEGFDANKGQLLIPGQAGIRFGADSPAKRLGLEYPTHWEAQFVVYENAAGGALIYARDPRPYFKLLQATREFGTLDVSFETFAVAPWAKAKEVPELEWRIKTYSGSWRSAVDYYKGWVKQHLPTRLQSRPEWVKETPAVIRVTNPDPLFLDLIAQNLDPKHTLLYLVNWRADAYDVNYPDYKPRAEALEFSEKARRLGFRIMLHVNALGVATYHPLYPSLEKFQIRSPETGLRVFWPFGLWPGGAPPPDYLPSFAFISPAASSFRNAWVGALREAIETLKPDALHVDAGGVMMNDSNGLLEGKTTIEGMIDLHRDLLSAYPNLVLSYESMTEFLSPLFSLAQRWNSEFPSHPIGSYFFEDLTTYGFLGQSNPDDQGFIDFIRRYEGQGVLPTLEVDSISGVSQDALPVTQLVFKLMRLWQEHGFRPDWESDWNGAVFRFISADRTTVAAVETSTNSVRLRVGDEIVYERVRNQNSLETPLYVRSWRAFSDSALQGLDPSEEYWLEPLPRETDRPRLSKLPGNSVLGTGTKATAAYGYFEMDRTIPQGFDFITAFPSAQPGVIYYGIDYALGRGATVDLTRTTVQGAIKEPVLFMQPPVGAPGAVVFLEYSASVPERSFPSFLNFSAALSDLATLSDGALFVVRISGSEVFRQLVTPGQLTRAHVDLRPWAGQDVRIRFIVHPGVRLNPVQDWAVWTDVGMEVQAPDLPQTFEITLPQGAAQPVIAGIESAQEVGTNVYSASADFPAQVAVFSTPPQTVQPGTSLLDLPYDLWRASQGGMALPGKVEVSGEIREVMSNYAKEDRALATYPPAKGTTLVTWPVHLSDTVSRLEFKVGLADAPAPLPPVKSYSGAKVTIRINGKPVWNRELNTAGWIEGSVDLMRWAGRDIIVELEADSLSNPIVDWVYWTGLTLH